MTTSLSRRRFLKTATLTTAGLLGAGTLGTRRLFGQESPATLPSQPPLYCFPLLGDIHFDRMSHHDMEWVRKEKPGDERQINGYVATTEKYTPRLLAEVAAAVKQAKATTAVPFVIQIGDLVEGLCGSYDLSALQNREAIECVEQADLGAPMLFTKGNHDITGPGAPEAFDKVFLPWLGKNSGQQLTRAHYTVRHADDLFVFFDAYKPDVDWLEQTLRDQQAKRVFFVIHPPVVPYNARSNWIVFANEKEQAQRARLLDCLGKSRAIVLSGHLHKYSLLTRQTPVGAFEQLAVISVIRNEVEKPRDLLEGADRYAADLLDLEPRFSPTSADRRRQILLDEKPFIERFEFADLPGYAMVNVYADRVDVDLFAGVGQSHWRSRPLSGAGIAQPA